MKALAIGERTKDRPFGGAVVICLAALQRAPLVAHRSAPQCGPHYRFGRRLFSADTVNTLIAAGLAERQGNKVVARG